MAEDRSEAFEAFEADMARRSPYGIHPDAKTAALAPMSEAAGEAAQNMLSKAIDRLAAGDADAAERFITRAASIPYDEHQGIWPGPAAADQMLFELLADYAEDWADAQEHPEDYYSVEWLHEAIGVVAPSLEPEDGAILRDVVETIVSDARILGIHPAEAKGLATAVNAQPDPAGAIRGMGLPRESSPELRVEVSRLHVGLYVRMQRVLDADGHDRG